MGDYFFEKIEAALGGRTTTARLLQILLDLDEMLDQVKRPPERSSATPSEGGGERRPGPKNPPAPGAT